MSVPSSAEDIRAALARLEMSIFECALGILDEADTVHLRIDAGFCARCSNTVMHDYSWCTTKPWEIVGSTQRYARDGEDPFVVYRVGSFFIELFDNTFDRSWMCEVKFSIDATASLPPVVSYLTRLCDALDEIKVGLREVSDKEAWLRSVMMVVGRVIPLSGAPVAQIVAPGDRKLNLERATPPTPGVFGEGMEMMLYRNPPRRL